MKQVRALLLGNSEIHVFSCDCSKSSTGKSKGCLYSQPVLLSVVVGYRCLQDAILDSFMIIPFFLPLFIHHSFDYLPTVHLIQNNQFLFTSNSTVAGPWLVWYIRWCWYGIVSTERPDCIAWFVVTSVWQHVNLHQLVCSSDGPDVLKTDAIRTTLKP